MSRITSYRKCKSMIHPSPLFVSLIDRLSVFFERHTFIPRLELKTFSSIFLQPTPLQAHFIMGTIERAFLKPVSFHWCVHHDFAMPAAFLQTQTGRPIRSSLLPSAEIPLMKSAFSNHQSKALAPSPVFFRLPCELF